VQNAAYSPPSAAAPTGAAANRWMPFIYFMLGQAGWFASVMGAARDRAWLGVVLVLVLIAGHLWRSSKPLEELKLIGTVAVLGEAWETGLVNLGLLSYPHGAIEGIAPVWLLGLWALFAAQFNTTYRWLKTRPFAAVILGMLAGPLSFRAGAALGALRFAKPWSAVLALAVGWGILLPTIALMSRRWNGVELRPPVNR